MKLVATLSISVLFFSPVTAQIPNTLLQTIASPSAGAQSGALLGTSVATEGNYTVAGAPQDDLNGENLGVVKVFDSTTGALLFLLPNPANQASGDNFGGSVAISGTRIAVSAAARNAGAFGAGIVYIYDLTSGTPTVPVLTLNNPDGGPPFATGDGFGGVIAMSGTRVAVAAWSDSTGAAGAGCAYVFDLSSGTPTVPVVRLNNPTPAFGDNFGKSIGISGTRVVVGAWMDDAGATDAGSAYVYDLTSGTPTVPVFTLNKPNPVISDLFGDAVAISGTRVVVGARFDDTGASNSGSAYVFDLSGATPTVPVATLNNPGPAANDNFGNAVAIFGTRIVVAADWDETGASDAGSAYVYDLTSGTPTVPLFILNNPSPAASDVFGYALAISSTRVVVTAYSDDMSAPDAGTAYVYNLSSGTPTIPAAILNNPGPSAHDQFGYAVAVSGTRVVVGAHKDSIGGTDAGRVYVYDLASSTPTVPVFTLNNPSTPSMKDEFGYSVAISGTRVAVGSIYDAPGGNFDAGSAYVYDLNSGTPTVPVLTVTGPQTSDHFGKSVGISGTRLVVGAEWENTGGNHAGSAFVYDLNSPTPAVPVVTLRNPSPGAGDLFGAAVAISGARVVVGAISDDTGTVNAGSAYVYDLSGNPTVPVATLNNPDASPESDDFGASVAVSGTHVVVGARYDAIAGTAYAGSAYVYDVSGSTPTVPVMTLRNPSPVTSDLFGYSVAISGTRLVLGAYQKDAGATDAGAAFVYDMSSGTPTVPVAALNNPVPAAGDNFGYSVGIDGTTICIGTPNANTPQNDKGAMFIFGPNPASPDADNDGLLDSWELTYWPSSTGHSALDDFDHDSIPELLELAFRLNPTLPSARILLTPVNESGYLTMTITKQTGVTYEVQSGGSLLVAQPDSFSAATTTVITNNATTLKVRDNFLIGTSPPRFMRVKVTAAP